ncbi:MAG: acetyl-CoA carboxylase biotin carboxylase subunit family protein [Desulfovibrionales bacterium]
MKKNIFVIGPDELNWMKLMEIQDKEEEYTFHELLAYEESHGAKTYDVGWMLDEAQKRLDAFEGTIDAIVSFWDFPVSLMLPILARRYKTLSPTLESVLQCEHKYWSRVRQQEAVPEMTPAFTRFDPFDDNALDGIELSFPFWIKPVKSFGGYLGFRINNADEFHQAVEKIRRGIHSFSKPMDELLQYADIPEEIRTGGFCIAEDIINGKQVTLEGFASQGEVDSHGIVDSFRHSNEVSFSRFQYPSALPDTVKERIFTSSKTLIRHIGFDNSPFNIEYFYNDETDELWLLEVNPRIAQSHSDLFKKVDGTSNHRIMAEVGLGNRPIWERGKGDFNVGAKLFIRSFEEGKVMHVPNEEQIAEAQKRFPGTLVQVLVEPGQHLSEMLYQDSYSFKLALVYMGADNEEELLENFEEVKKILDFRVEQ